MKRPQNFVAELVEAGLWEAIEDGWQLHDFLDYQPSKAQVTADRKKTAERQKRWRERHAETRDNGVSNGRSNGVTNGGSNAAPTRPDPSRPSYREEQAPADADGTLFDEPAPPKKKASRKKAETPIPDDFAASEAMRAWAAENTPGIDIDRATAKFINHAHANDRRQRDWVAAWRNWLLNEKPSNVVAIRSGMDDKHAMLARQRAWAEAEDAKELTR